MKQRITLDVNGELHDVLVEPHWTLLDVVREQLGLTGSKQGCDVGDCGSCNMLIDGKPQNSCIQLAIEAQGKRIQTIEGVARNGELHPLQDMYNKWGAAQCGYCNPGIIMTVLPLLEKNPEPSRAEIQKSLSSNLCRCTGYTKVIKAVEEAAKEMRRGKTRGKTPAGGRKPAGKK